MRLGVDLGGTKIEIIALEDGGRECFRKRVPTPQGDYPGTIRAIRDLVLAAENATGKQGSVGIATPGALSPASGLLKNSNSVCLNGQPVKQALEEALQRPVRMANDADCFALSEACDGAAAGAASVFGVIIGTGTGAGIVINGQPLSGPNAIAGEWGHNPLPWPQADELPGRNCYCGRSGCIETWLSGPGFAADHQAHSGQNLSTHDIIARATTGDTDCRASLQRYQQRAARALAHVINILDPHVIVLGGGMSNIDSLYTEIPKYWSPWVFSDRVDTRLVKNRHGDSSGVRGAAWLWPEQA